MRFKLLHEWAVATWALRQRARVTVAVSLLAGIGYGCGSLVSLRAESLQRDAAIAASLVRGLAERLNDEFAGQGFARPPRRSASRGTDVSGEQVWRLLQHFSPPTGGVVLADFRAHATELDIGKQGFALSLRGKYTEVIKLVEQTLEVDAETALLNISCVVGPNGGEQVDCDLAIERLVKDEARQ